MHRNTRNMKVEVKEPVKGKINARYQEFLVTTVSSTPETYGGYGFTLDDAIEWCVDLYRDGALNDYKEECAECAAKGRTPRPLSFFISGWDDMVIWRNGRVLAIVTPHPDLPRDCVVIRFDRERRPITEESAEAAPATAEQVKPRAAVPSKAARPKGVGRKPKGGGL